MKKTDKKMDNALRDALTRVCDAALHRVPGFIWLTHLVNYRHFPDSLRIVCVFATDKDLSDAYEAKWDEYFYRLIGDELNTASVQLKDVSRYIGFDTQEACEKYQDGKWNKRLSQVVLH